MAEPRETILAQLAVIAAATAGIAAVARNAADVPGLARPAMLIHDGGDTFRDEQPEGRLLFSGVSRVELTPVITILVAEKTDEVGALLNIFRARFLKGVFNDPVLLALAPQPPGQLLKIHYDGCTFEPATAESKEGRMEVHLVFTYAFRVSDL